MRRTFFFSLTLAALILALVAAVDVLSARVAPYDRPARARHADTFVVSSPTRVHQFVPDATFAMDGAVYHTNAMGFRDRDHASRKPDGTIRVAVLGDSFVEGMGEAQDATIPRVLERDLTAELGRPVEVFNAGVRGGSPAVYRWWLRALADRGLDAAVVCVFDNDMDDDACALLTKAQYRAAAWYRGPAFVRRSNLLSYLAGELAELRFEARRKEISREIFNEPDFHRDARRKDGAANLVGSNGFGYLVEPDAWRREWERTRGHLDEIVGAARSRGLPIVFVHIPANVLYPSRPGAPAPPKRDYFGDWLNDWARGAGVPFVDLSEPLTAWYRDGRNPPLYQDTYAHFNAAGLKAAAAWIRPAVVAALTAASG